MGVLIDTINKQKKYDGTQAWNDAGFRGQGINVWDMETILAEHGVITTRRITDNAPDAKVYTLSHSMISNSELVKLTKVEVDGKVLTAEEFIRDYDIKVCTKSVGGGTAIGGADSRYYNSIKEKYKVVFFASGGNDGTEGAGSSIPPDVAMWAGECVLVNGQLKMIGHSGVGREGKYDIDFSDFPGIWSGTSFASPALAGKCALIKSRYNRDMTQDEVYKYFKFCAKDIDSVDYPDEIGGTYDVKSGYGIVIMPNPNRKYVTMTIGKNDYYVDGIKKTMDTTPVLKDSRTFVPLRAISESLGAQVDWAFNDKKKIKVIIKYKGDEIILNEGENTIYKNGVPTQLDVAPFVNADSRTMIPLRGIVEILNGQIDWVEAEQKVMFLEGE